MHLAAYQCDRISQSVIIVTTAKYHDIDNDSAKEQGTTHSVSFCHSLSSEAVYRVRGGGAKINSLFEVGSLSHCPESTIQGQQPLPHSIVELK